VVGQGGLGSVVFDSVAPGGVRDVRLVLEPTGRVTGRVLLANGTAAGGIVGELVSAGSRRFFAESAADGTLTFDGLPLGSFTLNLTDPIGPGVARRSGTVTGDSQLGDILLDEVPPVVVSLSPAPASVGVGLRPAITIGFSEPIDLGTATPPAITLTGPAGAVAGLLASTAGDTAVTLSLLADLQPHTSYTVRVTGIRDRIGKTMAQEYVASFTTVDLQPPAVLEATPGPGTSGAPIYTTIRVKYSEMIDPSRFGGAPIVLTGSRAGRLAIYRFEGGAVSPGVVLSDQLL
jgi:hypothetical protein